MKNLLQLKIELNEITPKIWRRFLIKDNISFQDLHNIIQIVMSWEDYHLFEFQIDNIAITSDEEGYNAVEGSFKNFFSHQNF